MSTAPPAPVRFLRLGWAYVKRVPSIWLLRAGLEFGAFLFRFVLLFGVGLLFVVHFAAHVEAGLPLDLWVPRLATALGQPHTIIGLGGLAVSGWAIVLAAESFAFAGIWAALQRAATSDEPPPPWSSAFAGAFETFGRALGVRLLIRACEATLVVVVVGCGLAAFAVARSSAQTTSELALYAAACAGLFTVLAVAAVVLRLTAELVAATVYLDDVGLGEGILTAARSVLDRPFFIYRLFIIAAAVLIPPLMVGWFAAITQNFFVVADAPMLASGFRLLAEVAIVVGLVTFSVMLHATFFAYHAWATNRAATEVDVVTMKNKFPELTDLLPQKYPHMADVDQILGPWDDADVEARQSAAKTAPPRTPRGSYDLGAILARDEEE